VREKLHQLDGRRPGWHDSEICIGWVLKLETKKLKDKDETRYAKHEHGN
jgi:hypothetical protein